LVVEQSLCVASRPSGSITAGGFHNRLGLRDGLGLLFWLRFRGWLTRWWDDGSPDWGRDRSWGRSWGRGRGRELGGGWGSGLGGSGSLSAGLALLLEHGLG
jgi:hypothetical protein